MVDDFAFDGSALPADVHRYMKMWVSLALWHLLPLFGCSGNLAIQPFMSYALHMGLPRWCSEARTITGTRLRASRWVLVLILVPTLARCVLALSTGYSWGRQCITSQSYSLTSSVTG